MKRQYKIEIYKYSKTFKTYIVEFKNTEQAYLYALGLYNGIATFENVTGYHIEENINN